VIYRTDLDGTVLVRSDGAGYSVMTEKGGGNIWPVPGSVQPTVSTAPSTPMPPSITPVATSPALSVPVTLPTIPSNSSVPVPSFTIPPVQIGNASAVYISAIQFNAPGDDRENLNGEWVRLTNRGDDTVLLAGWTLSDRSSGKPYTFPAVILLPGTSVTVYTGSGTMNDTSLYMGRTGPVWGNSGDEASLKDGGGNIIDRRGE
jgi:competence protein ComEC